TKSKTTLPSCITFPCWLRTFIKGLFSQTLATESQWFKGILVLDMSDFLRAALSSGTEFTREKAGRFNTSVA
ncbi:hypothetical protein QCD79_30390, partial [Pseudomonas quasicaspiana]|nr:hypothetical protein [Pseudomonas quasicaspiana]